MRRLVLPFIRQITCRRERTRKTRRGTLVVYIAASLLIGATAVPVGAQPPSGPSGAWQWVAPAAMFAGDFLRPQDGTFETTLRSDGMLVTTHKPTGTIVWVNAIGYRRAKSAVLQEDGNFVLYTASNKALWATGTDGNGPASRLELWNDGNLVLLNSNGQAVWSTGSRATSYRVEVRTDQRLVDTCLINFLCSYHSQHDVLFTFIVQAQYLDPGSRQWKPWRVAHLSVIPKHWSLSGGGGYGKYSQESYGKYAQEKLGYYGEISVSCNDCSTIALDGRDDWPWFQHITYDKLIVRTYGSAHMEVTGTKYIDFGVDWVNNPEPVDHYSEWTYG